MKKTTILLVLTIIALISCKQSAKKLTYLYQDKEQSIICQTQDDALLNEALHTFEEALLDQLEPENRQLNSAYGKFIYQGFDGNAKYATIANQHTFDVRDKLLEQGIITTTGAKSNLNYAHPAVACVISKIESAKIKKTIEALVSIGDMNPKLFNSRLRNMGRRVKKDRYTAMYIALDGFYQRLATLKRPTTSASN